MCNPDLTLLHKLILSDVISFQIQGKQYFKTSPQLAKELGSYKTKTVQGGFQWLNDNGYLDCLPFGTPERLKYDLREARVIQIEKWIYDDAHLQAIGFNVEPPVKKDKNHPLKSLWANRRKKADVNPVGDKSSTLQTEQPKLVENHNWESYDFNWHDVNDETELTIGYQPTNRTAPTAMATDQPVIAGDGKLHINGEFLNFGCSLREQILAQQEAGRILKYLPAIITLDELVYEADVVRVNDEFNYDLKYMTRRYIETNKPW
jgi:hypothetical protein